MPVLQNKRHEAFARSICEGKSAVEAYRGAYGKNKSGERTTATRLLAKADIVARIDELAGKAAEGSILTKRQEMEFLTEVITTPAGKITKDSRLCQGFTQDGEKVTVKMPDKMRALEILAKMKGEFPAMEQTAPPVSVSVNVSVMTEDRRAELIRKKRESIQRRQDRMKLATNGNGHSHN